LRLIHYSLGVDGLRRWPRRVGASEARGKGVIEDRGSDTSSEAYDRGLPLGDDDQNGIDTLGGRGSIPVGSALGVIEGHPCPRFVCIGGHKSGRWHVVLDIHTESIGEDWSIRSGASGIDLRIDGNGIGWGYHSKRPIWKLDHLINTGEWAKTIAITIVDNDVTPRARSQLHIIDIPQRIGDGPVQVVEGIKP